jgi:hypothetical protein
VGGGAREQSPPGATRTFDLDFSTDRSDIVMRGYASWQSRRGPRLPARDDRSRRHPRAVAARRLPGIRRTPPTASTST